MFEIESLIADCVGAVSTAHIQEILRRALTDPAGVSRALAGDRAGITPLHVSADLSILNVIWAPGMSFRPHNHLMWAAIGLYSGREANRFFIRAADGLVARGGRELGAGDVVALGPDAIHSVTNPLSTFTGAIHVYGGDITRRPGRSEWDLDPCTEVPYDFDRVRRTFEAANSAL